MKSIQRRLTITLTALCCFLWFGGSLLAYLIIRAGLIHEFDLGRKADVDSLVNMTEQTEKGLKFDSTGEFMPAFQREDHPDYFQLWETDGSVLYRSPSLEETQNLGQRAGTLASPIYWNVALPDGQPGRAVGVHFIAKEDEDEPRTPSGPPLNKAVTLVAAFHRSELDQRLHYLGTVLLLLGLTMAIGSALTVGPLIRRGLRPLSALAERASTIDASSLQLRFANKGLPDELQPIVQRLNDLLERIEASFNRERRFSANVAHELRTPIAELRTLAEVALRWPDDRAATQNALSDALAIAVQMESSAVNLLALARCESNLFTVQPERLSIAAMVRETLPPLQSKADEKKLTFGIKVPSEASWFTDATALRCILTNLLTNAVSYSPPATTVRIELTRNGFSEQLVISNRNTELSPEDLPHLFERFWRKESARSSSMHNGLGLSVASAYARSIGIKLSAELDNGEIIFKLSPESDAGKAAS
jgi:signal transduction histidine kinase